MSTIKVNSIQPANSGSEDYFLSKAWVNFDGTAGTISPRASGNIGSLIDNGSGDYTINMSNALTDANYIAVYGASRYTTANDNALPYVFESVSTARTTTSIRVRSGGVNAGSFALGDYSYVEVALVR